MRLAVRVYRREWRQQILVIALLTFTVAGALDLIAAAYNTPDSLDARYGTANLSIRFGGLGPQAVNAKVAAVRARLGTIDVIEQRSSTIPGLTRPVNVQAQDPRGPYGAAMLRLVSGRYPTVAGEAAMTDQVAALMRLRVGRTLTLTNRRLSVVGVVENPYDLNAEFVLVPPVGAGPPESVTVLAAARPSRQLGGFLRRIGATIWEFRGADGRTAGATYALAVVVLAMFLVCFVAASAFITMAQRRTRQFGLLAATGATDRHVRLIMLAAGATTGTVAAALGAAVGAALWITMIPRLEPAVGHRIEPFSLPWWLIGACLLMGVVTATAAAWWPARAAARIPVTQALSLRPPRPRPARRWAVLGLPLLLFGVACLRLGAGNLALVLAGTAATLVALPFIGLLTIRGLTRAGARLPVAVRLAIRDLRRHQARSGAALAAISLGLAVAAVVVIAMAASEPTAAEGNLSDRQLLITVNESRGVTGAPIPERTPAETVAADGAVGRFAAALGAATVIRLDAAVVAGATPEPDIGGRTGVPPVSLLVQVPGAQETDLPRDISGRLFVATPEILRYYGLDPTAIPPGTDVLTPHTADDLLLPGRVGGSRWIRATTAPLPRFGYRSLPDSLLSPQALRRHGWRAVRTGWLIEAGRPLTTAQLAAARDLALENGLVVESRDTGPPQTQIRAAATTAGAVLALGVLAMTVGLLRGEAARDLRTLTATGANRRIRRTLAATTALALALLGAILGVGAAYLSVGAILAGDIDLLERVPVAELAVTIIGVPLIAAGGAWLFAGREPRNLTRQP